MNKKIIVNHDDMIASMTNLLNSTGVDYQSFDIERRISIH